MHRDDLIQRIEKAGFGAAGGRLPIAAIEAQRCGGCAHVRGRGTMRTTAGRQSGGSTLQRQTELPEGIVTLLFTDIEGSTALMASLGDRYADALAGHRERIRSACGEHDGVEVDTQGDAFFFAFARATDALAAAEKAQRLLAETEVKVRMGLHTGQPALTAEGYVGLDVHRGARICAVAHGGQVVLSQTTRDLIDAEILDLGDHRLKDIPESMRLSQLGSERFPPLRGLIPMTLPAPATRRSGRERELTAGVSRHGSDGVRLLTVTGPGGAGKTRLAGAAAS